MRDERLGDSTGLVCRREDQHLSGHVFVASSLSDAHDDTDSAARSGDER